MMSRSARCAAMTCLPAALASVLLSLPAGVHAQAEPPDLHTQIEYASKREVMKLELVNGHSISGKFNGFVGDWSDAALFASRYEAWRSESPDGAPALGQPVILKLASGESRSGRFQGVGPTFLVLESGDSRFDDPVNFDAIVDARSAEGEALAPWTDLRGRLREAPSIVGVGLKVESQSVIVTREAILWAEPRFGEVSSMDSAARVALVAVGVVVLTWVFIQAFTVGSGAHPAGVRSTPAPTP